MRFPFEGNMDVKALILSLEMMLIFLKFGKPVTAQARSCRINLTISANDISVPSYCADSEVTELAHWTPCGRDGQWRCDMNYHYCNGRFADKGRYMGNCQSCQELCSDLANHLDECRLKCPVYLGKQQTATPIAAAYEKTPAQALLNKTTKDDIHTKFVPVVSGCGPTKDHRYSTIWLLVSMSLNSLLLLALAWCSINQRSKDRHRRLPCCTKPGDANEVINDQVEKKELLTAGKPTTPLNKEVLQIMQPVFLQTAQPNTGGNTAIPQTVLSDLCVHQTASS